MGDDLGAGALELLPTPVRIDSPGTDLRRKPLHSARSHAPSVFECRVNEMQLEEMRNQLLKRIDIEKDSLRIYHLVEPREARVEAYGRDTYVDFESPLVL